MVDSMFTFIAVGLIVGVHVATMIVLDLVVVQPMSAASAHVVVPLLPRILSVVSGRCSPGP